MSYTTEPSIFSRLRSGDEITWDHFYKTYRALVILRGRDLGLADVDLDELLSRVMLKFFQHQSTFHYDRSKGRFRDYFRTIVTHAALDILRERKVRDASPIDDFQLSELPQSDELNVSFDREWHAHIFQQALQEARVSLPPRAVQAFILCRLQEVPSHEVARLQSVGKSTVYNDCNVVWEFLQETVRRMANEY